MRLVRTLIVASVTTFVLSLLTPGGGVDAQTNLIVTGEPDSTSSPATAAAPSIKGRNFDLNAISKAIVDQASRLKNDATGWDEKFQELELDLA